MVRIFVRRPSGNFVEARYADLTLPSVTLHEAVAARRALLAKGRQEINTRAIVGTAIAQRKLVEAQRQAEETRRALAALNKTLTETGLLRDEFMAVLRHDLQRNCSWCTGG
jgi:putative transposase